MKKSVNRKALMSLAGTTREGVLLERVCHWTRYAQIELKGRKWMAKTRSEWADDTGMSESQVKRSLVRLRKREVVVTEQHIFGNRCVNFLRLTDGAAVTLGLDISVVG